MSARLARNAFASVARRAQTTASTTRLASRRAMSSGSHAGTAKSKSDTPWIVGSALVFIPAFLYLVSPSARKSEHLVHDDRHDYPTLKHKEAESDPVAAEPVEEVAPVVTMADDEGTVADVSASIAVSEESDVPKASPTEKHSEVETASTDAETPAPEEVTQGEPTKEAST